MTRARASAAARAGVVQPSHLRISQQYLDNGKNRRHHRCAVRRARPQPIRPRRACTRCPSSALFVSLGHGQSDAVLLVRRGDEEICRIRRRRETTKQRKKQRRQLSCIWSCSGLQSTRHRL